MRKRIIIIIVAIIIILIVALLFRLTSFGCTQEAKLCPDGTAVGRTGVFCKFESCPNLKFCDSLNQCSSGMECYKFQDSEKPYCFAKGGSPCIKCSSRMCDVLESYPIQVICK